MPWTVADPPRPATNWTQAEKKKCVTTANAVLRDGGTEQDAIFACIRAAGKTEHPGGEGKALSDDMLIAYGGAVKALANGRIEGYLVKFTDAEHLDLDGEFFDARTDYDFEDGERTSIYYQHGHNEKLGRRKIGEGTLKIDDVGVWLAGELALRDEYEQVIYGMAEGGKQGFSSGTASHLVEREREGKGVHITRWPLRLDASLTPTPAEPSTRVLTLKAYKALNFEPPKADSPQGDVLQTPPATAATKSTEPPKAKKVKRKGGKIVGLKRYQIGTMYYAYDVNEEGERDGDPKFGSIKAEDVDSFVADGLKPDWQRALEMSNEAAQKRQDELIKAFTAQTAAKKPGLYATGNAQAKTGPTFGDFIMAVGRKDLNVLKAMGSTYQEYEQEDGTKVLGDQSGAEGGFTVPTQFLPELIRIEPEEEIVWPTARIIPMQSRSVEIPGLNTTGSTAGQTNTLGGMLVEWTETGTCKPEHEPEFTQIELVAHEISAYTEVKLALLQDSAISLDPLLKELFRDALMYYTDEAFLDGTGAGQPQGIITAPGTLVLARDTAGRILYEDVKTMLMHFMVRALGGAFWTINQFCMAEIMDMVDQAGHLIWQPNARESIPTRLLGLPIKWTEKTPGLGNQGDIILMNAKWYYIGKRQGVTIGTTDHLLFRSNRRAYRCVMRVDGQEALPAPVFAKGSINQYSPFVVLGAAAT